MTSNTIQKLYHNKPAAIIAGFIIAAVYLVSDPALNRVYWLYCTYRMQTAVIYMNYFILAVVYVLFVASAVFYNRREKTGQSFGALGPYILIYLGYLTATLANPETGSLEKWADSFFYSLVPLMIAVLFFQSKEGACYYIRVISTLYLVLAALNIIYYFFPQLYFGEAKEWREPFFLGFDNKAGWPLMMGMFFVLVDWRVNGNRKKAIAYFLLLLVNIRIVWCITALLGTVILIGWLFFPYIRRWAERWDFLVFLCIILILFICLMFLQKYTVASEPVALFIEEILHKKRTMSGRLPLWQLGVAIVMKKPWLGVGTQLHPGFIHMSDEYGVWSYYHAHNELLQTWYEGGLLTVLLAVGMLVFTAGKLRKCRNKSLVGVCKTMLFIFLFMLLSDNMPYYTWYMVAMLAHISILSCNRFQNAGDEEEHDELLAEELNKWYNSLIHRIIRKS